jgi:hypothetical protein
MRNFSQSLDPTLRGDEISLYKGNIISDESIVRYSVKIRKAFPSLPPGFYDILLEMAKEEGFTDERFRDAVHHVIKTCIYPTPSIAQFISFDKRVQTFTYEQMLKKLDESGGSLKFWDNYKAFKFKNNARRVYIHVNDVQQFNITE